MNLGAATVEGDSVMYQGDQIGDIFENELTLWVDIESVVNNELTITEVQALVTDLPAIRAAIAASTFKHAALPRPSDVDQIAGLAAAYKTMWDAVYG